ncbi:MAG: chemotaxis protein CheB, partial [Gallionella sp.]
MSGYRCIAIGTSLGGLRAVSLLLAALRGQLSVPVCLVQHRRVDVESLLPGLLQAHTSLLVIEPDDRAPLLAGRLYVAPSNYHLIIEREQLRLSVEGPVYYARPSIDVLFESLAMSFGARAIAV